MTRVLIQCKRELLIFARDILTVMLAFLLPSASLVLVGFAIRLEAKSMPIVVQNYDIGSASRELEDRLYANNQVTRVRWKAGDPVKNALDSGIAKMAITIPPEFSRKLKAGEPTSFSVLIDGTDVNNARVLKSGLLGTLTQVAKKEAGPIAQPVTPVMRIWFNPGRKESLYIVPGAFGFMLWVYPSLLAALSASREREYGTVLQIYSSSIKAWEFIAGKILAFGLIACMQALILFVIAALVFRLHLVSDLPSFLLGTVFFVLTAVTFGVMAGNYSQTQVVAVQLCSNTGMTFSMLFSGYIIPVRDVAFPFNLIAYFVPLKYYILLCRDAFVRGGGWSATWHLPLILSLFMAAMFALSWLRIRNMNLEH
ncbi:MAG TPA: ABC transporter permease [Oculatellaceae cyanobacterium]